MRRGGQREAFHNLVRCEPWHLIYFTKRTDVHIFMSWDLKQDSCFPSTHHHLCSLWACCWFTRGFPGIALCSLTWALFIPKGCYKNPESILTQGHWVPCSLINTKHKTKEMAPWICKPPLKQIAPFRMNQHLIGKQSHLIIFRFVYSLKSHLSKYCQ